MESDDEDDAFTMGEREWQKMRRDLGKQGYRDGKTDGREHGMQKSFEQAASLSFKKALKIGQVLGVIEWKLSQGFGTKQSETLRTLEIRLGEQLESLKKCSMVSTSGPKLNIINSEIVKELLSLSILHPKEVEIIESLLND